MTQAYENVLEIKEVEESKKSKVQKPTENEADELLGDLNPRYFEETYSFDQAMQKVYASRSSYNLI